MENLELQPLHAAAFNGDMDFLRKALATLPIEELLAKTPTYQGNQYNIIHPAIYSDQEEFLRELVEHLPPWAVHSLLSEQDNSSTSKFNAFHYAALRGNVGIAKLFLGFYRSFPSSSSSPEKPWLAVDVDEKTPLQVALEWKKEEFALEIMSMDTEMLCNMVDSRGTSPLLEAIRQRCERVALKILTSGHSYSTSGDDGLTPLDLAPNCSEEICRLLLDKHPEMIKKADSGYTLLHLWVRLGKLWPFQLLLKREATSVWRKDFIDLLCTTDQEEGRNPLHVAATLRNEEAVKIVQLLVEAYIDAYEQEKGEVSKLSPWKQENKLGQTPMMDALVNGHDELALYFLSLDIESLVLYESKSALCWAAFYGCDRSVEKMLTSIDPGCFSTYPRLVKLYDGRNVLHAASNCTESTGRLLVETLPFLINEPDGNGHRPIDTASEAGTAWLIKLLLTKDPSSITNAPYSWILACEKGHLEAIDAFINYCPDFRKLCLEQKDSLLHHIKLRTYREYNEFLEIPLVNEFKNTADSDGATPLHHAVGNKDLIFTEVLLTTEGMDRSIKDKRGKSATDLLVELCNQNHEWDAMCKRIGINPRLKTTYIQPTKLRRAITRSSTAASAGEMRGTLSVVAALLATLTFAAGFTLPGGFSSDTGEAILSNKAPFLIFMLADTYAMCCAMLVLFCLIWSMVCDHDRSLLLIDRGVVILLQSLYGTLLAFMTGVYTVISKKSLWAAILVFAMCSLVAISANRSILYRLLDKFIPPTDRKTEEQTRSLEEFQETELNRDPMENA